MTTLAPRTDQPEWHILNAYFQHPNQLVQHQLDSFHDFVEVQMPHIMHRKPMLVVNKEIKDDPVVKKVQCRMTLSQPECAMPMIMDHHMNVRPLFPHEARMRNVSYVFPVTCKVDYTVTFFGAQGPLHQQQHESKQLFTYLPSMVQSKYCNLATLPKDQWLQHGECPYDDGAYFLINGNEKVVIAQEKMSDNRLFIFEQKQPLKFSHIAEIRSLDESSLVVNTMQLRLKLQEQKGKHKGKTTFAFGSRKAGTKSLGGQLVCKVSHVKKDIPLFILFKALAPASCSDRDVLHYILGPFQGSARQEEYMELLTPSIEEALECPSKQSCMEYILDKFTVKLTKEDPLLYVDEFLEKKVFPQYGNDTNKKLFYLGYCVRQLLDNVLGYRRYSDRDHYGNKRLENTGMLMTQLFVQVRTF